MKPNFQNSAYGVDHLKQIVPFSSFFF